MTDLQTEWNLKRLGPEVEPIQQSFAMLSSLMSRITTHASTSKWPQHGLSIAMLFGWSLGRLVNAYRLALDGYVCDAAMLWRGAWEAKWQLIAFDIEASQVSSEADSRLARWIGGEWIGQREIRQMLPAPEILKDRYSAMSALTHPGNVKAVQLQVQMTSVQNATTVALGIPGIRNAKATDAILGSIWEETLDLIGYVPFAFPKAVDDAAALDEWRQDMMSRHRGFAERVSNQDGQTEA